MSPPASEQGNRKVPRIDTWRLATGWQRQGRRPWRWSYAQPSRHRQAALDAATRISHDFAFALRQRAGQLHLNWPVLVSGPETQIDQHGHRPQRRVGHCVTSVFGAKTAGSNLDAYALAIPPFGSGCRISNCRYPGAFADRACNSGWRPTPRSTSGRGIWVVTRCTHLIRLPKLS